MMEHTEVMYKSLHPLVRISVVEGRAKQAPEKEVNSDRYTKSLTLILSMIIVHMIVRGASYLRSMPQASYHRPWCRLMSPRRLVSKRRQALQPGVKRQVSHIHTHLGKPMSIRSHRNPNSHTIHWTVIRQAAVNYRLQSLPRPHTDRERPDHAVHYLNLLS